MPFEMKYHKQFEFPGNTSVFSVRTASSCVLKHIRKANQELRGSLKPGGNKRTNWFTCGMLQQHIHNTYVHTRTRAHVHAHTPLGPGIYILSCCTLQEIYFVFIKEYLRNSEWTVQRYHSENLSVHAVSIVYKLCATVLYYHSRWQTWELSAQSQCCASCSLTSRHGRPLNDDETPLCKLPVVLYLQKCDIWIKQNDIVFIALLSCTCTM